VRANAKPGWVVGDGANVEDGMGVSVFVANAVLVTAIAVLLGDNVAVMLGIAWVFTKGIMLGLHPCRLANNMHSIIIKRFINTILSSLE